MTFFAPDPHLTTNVAHDERFLEHIERAWKTDLTNFVQNGVPKLVFAFLLAFLFQSIITFFVKRLYKKADRLVGNAQRSGQLRTMAAILRATSYGITGFYLLTQVLAALGVSLGPFIASAGVIGLGISFGAQSIFKDMLTGIFILIENQYSVGDTIKIAGLTGVVEDLSLRVTRLRDGDGTVYIVPNSQITTVSNLSRDFAVGTLNISVDAREDPDRVMSVLKNLAVQVRKDEAFKDIVIADPNILGVDKISGYEVVYPINVRVMVNQRDGVMRELRRRVLMAFNKEKIAFGSSNSTMIVQSPAPDPPSTLPQPPQPASSQPSPSAASPNATT
ncbi:mechanosensitive ion channel family protein [Granulicella sp. L46]|uniref:mechanosensitive ion channel family protein n=1 Tax=Granulicella sp. L46 TaxID=1641865 RepID=UPI00131EB526|nr:mechanosensitive ion channel family protein [Granulicella sp. L46]